MTTIKAGELYKLSDFVGQWRKRFVCLTPHLFSYWEDRSKNRSPPKQTVPLPPPPAIAVLTHPCKIGLFAFSVNIQTGRTLEQVLVLATDTEEERVSWSQAFIHAASGAINAHRQPSSARSGQTVASSRNRSSGEDSVPLQFSLDDKTGLIAPTTRVTLTAASDVSAGPTDLSVLRTGGKSETEESGATASSATFLSASALGNSRASASGSGHSAAGALQVSAAPVYTPAPVPAEPFGGRLRSKLAEMLQLESSRDMWTTPVESGGVLRSTAVDGMPSCKGTIHIPFPRAAIMELLLDMDAKKDLDDLFDCGHHVKTFDAHSNITYLRFKSPVFVVGPRDFCSMTHWTVEKDGTFVIVAFSTDYDECPPLKVRRPLHVYSSSRDSLLIVGMLSAADHWLLNVYTSFRDSVQGFTRADLIVGGWVVRPRPGISAAARSKPGVHPATVPPAHMDPAIDADGCDVTYLMKADMKGSLPSSVVAVVASKQAMQVRARARVRVCMCGCGCATLAKKSDSLSAPVVLTSIFSIL
jgi:hypothetical protein